MSIVWAIANLEVDHREFRIRSSRGVEENLITLMQRPPRRSPSLPQLARWNELGHLGEFALHNFSSRSQRH